MNNINSIIKNNLILYFNANILKGQKSKSRIAELYFQEWATQLKPPRSAGGSRPSALINYIYQIISKHSRLSLLATTPVFSDYTGRGFPSFRRAVMIRRRVTTVAKRSLNGKDHQMPSMPISEGNHKSNGNRKITWRVRLRNIDLPAWPIDWKKVVDTTWNPTIQNTDIDMRRARAVELIRASLLRNSEEMARGQISEQT